MNLILNLKVITCSELVVYCTRLYLTGNIGLKYWIKVLHCGNQVPTNVTTKKYQKPVKSRVHACQIKYKAMSGQIS